MNILEEIKSEHEEFRELMNTIESSEGSKKKELFEKLYVNVVGHHEAEEHVLFNDVKESSDKEGKSLVLEMIEEHSLIDYQFSVVQKTSISNETWDAKFSVLKEIVTHHLDEEEDELFKQAKQVIIPKMLEAKYSAFEENVEKYKKEQEKKLK